MVVLVYVVVTFLCFYFLCRVVLVVWIYVPSLDTCHDVSAFAEIPFSLEVTVFQEVLLHVSVLYHPFGL